MGWVSGPRLVSGTANAGGLGILASATMTFEELEKAILEVKSRTDQPFGVNLRADAADAPDAVRPADQARREGRVVRARAQAGADQEAQGPRHRGDAVDRRRQARGQGRRLGRRRGDDPGRRGRRPHRSGADHAAAADRARRRRHPGRRRRRLLRRPRPRRGAVVRRRRCRHGHPLPAHPGHRRAGRGQAALPRHRPHRHRRDRQGRRHAAPDAAHRRSSSRSRRPRRSSGSDRRSAGPWSSRRTPACPGRPCSRTAGR